MSFKRFVETGRIAYIVDGQYKGKLCSIVDIIDQTRVLVDGPETGVPRQGIRLNQINLTKFRMKFPRTGGTAVVRRTWRASKIDEKWKESMWAKNLIKKKKRLEMTDFDRFKLRSAITKRNKIRSEVFFKLRKQACRKNALFGMKKTKKSEAMIEAAKKKALARTKRKEALIQKRAEKAKAEGKPVPKIKQKAEKKPKVVKPAEKPKEKKVAEKPKAKQAPKK